MLYSFGQFIFKTIWAAWIISMCDQGNILGDLFSKFNFTVLIVF